MMAIRFQDYLQVTNFLAPFQSILKQKLPWCMTLGENEPLLILLDLSIAFDTTDHGKILELLPELGMEIW